MKRHRHTPDQAVCKLREGERLLNDGKDLRTPGAPPLAEWRQPAPTGR